MHTTSISGSHAHVWTYQVKPETRLAFVAAYGPEGDWARFYSQCPDYIRTDLLTDESNPDRFLTIDYFKTKESRDEFVAARKAEFDEIDQRWEDATIEEEFVGLFKVQSEA